MITIAEIPSGIWNFTSYLSQPISSPLSETVSEYLEERDIRWVFGDVPDADFRVYKDENLGNGLLSVQRLKNEYRKHFGNGPYMNINGEAQEHSRLSYALADPDKTYSVAPGTRFKRIYFPVKWRQPHIDTWKDRLDRVCIIGRPLPERIELVSQLRKLEVPFDVYGPISWDIPEWKGHSDDIHNTALQYKYQIVYENSLQDLYHSEKLMNSIMAGCVTFYRADYNLVLPVEGAFLRYSNHAILNRDTLSDGIVENMKKVIFGGWWELYSFKSFFDTIVNEAERQI